MKKITKVLLAIILTLSVFTITPVFAEPTSTPTTEPTAETTIDPSQEPTESVNPENTIEPSEEATVVPEELETPESSAVAEEIVAADPVMVPVVYGITPRAALIETPLDSSKKATSIGNNQYEISFSFPGKENTVTPTVDVMIVMDKSSIGDMAAFKAALNNMIDTLAANTDVNYKVGFIMFDNRVHDETNGLLELNNPANVTLIKNAITNASGGGGTTLIGGVEVGKKYLDADTSVPAENKFLVLTTDFGGYLEYSDAYQANTSGLFYMYGYDDATGLAVSEMNYDIERHRLGCTDMTSADIANLVDNGVLLTRQPVTNMSWLSDGGDDSSFSYLGGADIQGKYDAGINIIPRSALGLPTTPIAWEHTIYRVGKMLQEMDDSGYHLEAITTWYHPENAYTKSISNAVADWFDDSFGNRFDVNAGGTAPTDAVNSITSDIMYLVQKATLYDTVNTTNFNLDATSFEVTLSGVTLPKTVTATGYGFGTPTAGVYPYEVITDGTSSIEFNINVKVAINDQLVLTFIEELKPETVGSGVTNLNTNTGDVHVEFMNSAEYAADPNTYTMRHTYPSPVITLNTSQPTPGPFLVTYLDCFGNTVKIEWVSYGGSSSAPNGNFSGASNVTAHTEVKQNNCGVGTGYKVPNTADKK